MSRLLTVGHSNHALAAFLDLLRAHGVALVADVRRRPASRRHPHFTREALAPALAAAGIGYRHLEALGGHRAPAPGGANGGLDDLPLRGYADHMQGGAFAAALAELVALAASGPVAVLCAEADPAACHRSLLADALLARGHAVAHIRDRDPPAPHRLHPLARVADGRVTYPAPQGSLGLTD